MNSIAMPITICIVEDDVELSASVARYLDGASGFRCIGAFASGEEALEQIPKKQPAVVLMDINLPGMSGIECVRRLRAVLPGDDPLSPREQQVLELLAKTAPYKQIAEAMGIGIETIRTYIRRIYEKLHVHSRIEAVMKYMGGRDKPVRPMKGSGR